MVSPNAVESIRVVEMKLLERRLTLCEEKYGILSEDFHAALMAGKLARYVALVAGWAWIRG